MNRNKKPFTPGMRVAVLYLLMGVLLLLAVTLFSGRESMRATEEYFDRTINFVKVQSTSYEKYNDTITAKSLRRMAVSVRQLAENDALDIYDPEALRKETESLWLTGIAVLDENGESLCEYTDGNIDYAQFAESLREQAALNVLQNPQKTYLKRILLQDGTAVDVATRRAAAGDAVLLAYRVTPPEFVEGTALSIQSVLDGYPKNISGTIFIVQDNKVIAANDPSLIGLYTTNSPLVQGIRKAGAPDILTHTRDWANSGCYFGMYSNGQNFDLYLYIDEKSVFRNFSSALLTALIFYLICVAVLQTLRRRSMKLAEQQKREQEQKYHAQLEEQNRKLELAVRHEAAANRAKREFLFNMSHDIRTPMNAIIGFTSLAATHVNNKEQVLDYLKKISTSSQHLLSLINDVLDMSRIESGKVKIEEKAVHLPDLVHDIRSIIQPNISSKRLALFIDTMDVVDEDIITDPLRLNQVLLNILSNAIKFTPTGGMVSIRIAQKPGAPKGCGNYEFRIKDNGIGINKEFQKHIFEEFTREESSTVSGIQGTGLGLSITKNIVDLMGGTITLESEPGKGSEFIVNLCFPPQRAEGGDQAAAPAGRAAGAGGGRRHQHLSERQHHAFQDRHAAGVDHLRQGSSHPHEVRRGAGRCLQCVYHRLAHPGYERHRDRAADPQGHRGQLPHHHPDRLRLGGYRGGGARRRCDRLLRKAALPLGAAQGTGRALPGAVDPDARPAAQGKL